MGVYDTKTTDYGYKERISIYSSPIAYGEDCKTRVLKRQKYDEMSDLQKKESDERRKRYYKKKISDLINVAMMNTDLTTAVTLTFKDSIISYDRALIKWQLFIKRLRHSYPNLKYICAWEYQKKRSEKEGIEEGGVYHFHFLTNIGYLDHAKLEKIWGNGFVWIDRIQNENQRVSSIRYTLKYIVKQIEGNLNERRKRLIFTSNNLIKPVVYYSETHSSKENIIFNNMESVISDGEYEIKNAVGRTINKVQYVELKKGE